MSDFAEEVRRGSLELRKILADVGGANSPEMRAAGRALAKQIRKQLSVKASAYQGPLRAGAKQKFAASAPGESPRRQTGRLLKSIGTEVVGGVLRVGSGRFTSRILQDGTTHATRGASVDRAGKRRHKRKALKRASVTIAPRPFMERALEAALPNMEGDFVGVLAKRTGGG